MQKSWNFLMLAAIILATTCILGCGLASGSGTTPASPLALLITTSSLPPAMVSQPYITTLQASGGVPPYTWSLPSGQLPAGLTLQAAGQISGTPTLAASFTFTVSVDDNAHATASKQLSMVISQSLNVTTSSLPAGTVGQSYSATLQASGGTTPYTWSVSAGTLPGGLSLNSSSGAISGIPTAAGTFNFTVKVADANSFSSIGALSISVSSTPGALKISTTSLPGGTVGQSYSATLQASGGTTPYTWSVSAGTLPGGLSLNSSSGAISGTPTAAGTFSFTAKVTDAGGATATQALSIIISSTSSLVGCGATNGGAAAYDQSTCGNVGASFSPVGTSISSCGTLTAGSYTLTANVGSSPNVVCFTIGANVVLNLGGFTVTGMITAATHGTSGIHLYNGTINCSADICVDLANSDTITAPLTLEYLTVTNSSTASSCGKIFNIDWSGTSTLGSAYVVVAHNNTTTACPASGSARTSNYWVVLGQTRATIYNNLMTCPTNANACQGVTFWNNAVADLHNNNITMNDTTSLAQDGRAAICDGDSSSCVFYNNLISAANNRAFRIREYVTSGNPGPFDWHDNRVVNVKNTTEGMIHAGDPDAASFAPSNDNNLVIHDNTFVFGPNALGVFIRDDAGPGPVIRNNTFQCDSSAGCSGSLLAHVSPPIFGTSSNLTMKNSFVDPAIGPTVVDIGGTLNYCNCGTCSSNGGTCLVISPCTNP